MIITEGAVHGLDRCRHLLAEKSPEAAHRAGMVIGRRLASLETAPASGRPVDGDMILRELPISFGDSGYVALYCHVPEEDAVYVLAIRHQREAGYW